MDMSVVIRCGDDHRVFDCVESIDQDVDVIVALSENAKLQRKLESMGIKYCITPRGNLSKTSNIGISNASYNKVIITDSDTTFEPGTIAELYRSLDQFLIARARIRFIIDEKKASTRVVSMARDYVNTLPLVYTPGIAFRKEVMAMIGGFMFNDLVPYAVDADMNYRIVSAKIPVKFDEAAMINHYPEGVRTRLESCLQDRSWMCNQLHEPEKEIPLFDNKMGRLERR